MEQTALYDSTLSSSGNILPVPVKTFVAPGDPSMPPDSLTWYNRPASSYASNGFVFGDEGGGANLGYAVPNGNGGYARLLGTIPNGTSNTIGYGERFCICNQDGGPAHLGGGQPTRTSSLRTSSRPSCPTSTPTTTPTATRICMAHFIPPGSS